MSDYVPASKRGRYFGWRNRTVGAVTVGSSITSGLLLNFFQELSYGTGFCIIFSLAAAARCVSAYFISRMDEPPHKKDPTSDFTFVMFLRRFRKSNFLKFVGFQRLSDFRHAVRFPTETIRA
jgi:MFS family permease